MNALLRAGGTTVAVLLGLVTGVWEAFLSPLHAGRVPLPVAPVLAVLVNLALVWGTRYVTRHRLLALLPGVAWFAVVLVWLTKTSEGDLVIPGDDWMGVLVVLLGAAAWGVGGYWLILAPTVDRHAATPPAGPAARRAGDGASPANSATPRAGEAPATASNATRRAGAVGAPRAGARPARSGGRPASGRRSGGGRSGGGRARP